MITNLRSRSFGRRLFGAERGLTRRFAALCGALVVAAGLVAATAPTASAADSMTYLPGVGSVGEVVVGGGKVFLNAQGRIVVADAQGALIDATIDLSEVSDLAITPDGTRLYATLNHPGEVVEIDTADLSVTRRIDLAAYPCPKNLSLARERLWVGYGCGFGTKGGVLALDLSATTPEPVGIDAGDYEYGAPLVAAAGSTLVVGETGITPADLMVYDVGATPATPATLRGIIDGNVSHLGYPRELAITADGSMVIAPVGSLNEYDGWDTTSLTRVRTYAGVSTVGSFVSSVAISPDGGHLAGGFSQGVALYDAETGERTHTYTAPFGNLINPSVAFSGNDDVFAVVDAMSTGEVYLWRLHNVFLPSTTLTLTAPSTAIAREPLTLTGRLTLPGGAVPGARPLVVTRVRADDGTTTTLSGVTTAEDGTFTVTDIPPFSGQFSYKALWDGDSEFRGSSSDWAIVTLDKHESLLTLSGPAAGEVGKELQITGTLDTGRGALAPGSSLTVRRGIRNGTRIVGANLPAVTPAADGSFAFTDTPPQEGQYVYVVQWAGDASSSWAQGTHSMVVQGGVA